MEKIEKLITDNSKAIIPVVAAPVLWGLEQVGITGDMTIREVVTLGVTAVFVWFVRLTNYNSDGETG